MRLLQYCCGTIDMPLTISIEDMNVLKTWIDASYAIHGDMRSHTGRVVMMGKEALYGKCGKQGVNVKSFLKAELIGTRDFLFPNHMDEVFH